VKDKLALHSVHNINADKSNGKAIAKYLFYDVKEKYFLPPKCFIQIKQQCNKKENNVIGEAHF